MIVWIYFTNTGGILAELTATDEAMVLDNIAAAPYDDLDFYVPPITDDEMNFTDYYIDVVTKTPVLKQNFPALNVSVVGYEITITNIPLNTTAFWPDGAETLENDGILECTVNVPGSYVFSFTCAPYYRGEMSVNVT